MGQGSSWGSGCLENRVLDAVVKEDLPSDCSAGERGGNKQAVRGAGLICWVVAGSWSRVGCDIPGCCGDVTAPNLMLLPLRLGMLCSGLRRGCDEGEDWEECEGYHPSKAHSRRKRVP